MGVADTEPVVVIGAGISGLAAAWAAHRAGRRVLLFEAADRVGGVIATVDVDGYRLELGPSSMMETAEIADLVGDVGIAESRIAPRPEASRRYLVRDGRAVAAPSGPLSALATPLLSLPAKLRLLAEPLVPAARDAGDETVAAFVSRRFGAEPLAALVDPIVSGVYAGDPARLSARHTLRTLHEMERRDGSVLVGMVRGAMRRRRATVPGPRRPRMFSFERGLRQLPDAMAASLGSGLRLRTRVTALHRDGDGWTLATDRGGQIEHHRASTVILAAPAHTFGMIEADPALDRLLASIVDVPHAPVATVALGFRREDIAHPLDGFGVLAPSREGLDVLGVLFASSVFAERAPDGHVLLTCFVGGARRPELALQPMARLERRAIDAVRSLLGIRGAPTFVHGTRWTPGIPQYEVTHDSALQAAAEAETRLPGLLLVGSWRGGVSLGDCICHGLAAGRRAAAAVRATTTPVDRLVPALR